MRVHMSRRQDQAIHEQFIIAIKGQGLTVRTPNDVSFSFAGDEVLSGAIRALGANHRWSGFLGQGTGFYKCEDALG